MLAALRGARLELIALAGALNFVHILCKSERWRVMLAPAKQLGRARLYYYLLVSYAASALLPARAGEVLRIYLPAKRDQVPAATSIGVVLGEKVFDAAGLLLVVAPLPLVLKLPRWASISLGLAGAGGAVAMALLLVFVWRARTRVTPGSRWARLQAGLAGVLEPRIFALTLGWSVAAVLVDASEIWLILRALAVSAPWAGPALILLTVNLALLVPAGPAHLGAFEAGAVAALKVLGVPLEPALAFALVYHLMQVVPVLLVGLFGLRLIGEARAAGDAEPPLLPGQHGRSSAEKAGPSAQGG